MMIPSSITRFVEASRKASAGTKPAPFLNNDLAVAIAAKLHELDIKPKKVQRATLPAPASPIDFFIRSLVTNT